MALLTKKKVTDDSGGEVVAGTYIYINFNVDEKNGGMTGRLVAYKSKQFSESDYASFTFKELSSYQFALHIEVAFWKDFLFALNEAAKQHIIKYSDGYFNENDFEIFLPE